jgi:DNA uptake protein ComE-like DNA-binding protein
MALKRWLSGMAAQSVARLAVGRLAPAESSLQQRLRENPLLRFDSLAELQAAAGLGVRIDVAGANQEDWLRLPGLSIHQARTLAELGQAGVPFHCLDDLAAALGLSLQQVAGYGPILQFCFYGEEERSPLCNANHAPAPVLAQLPGLDSTMAAAIIQARQSQGAFLNLADFQRRLGLDAAAIEQLMHYLRF